MLLLLRHEIMVDLIRTVISQLSVKMLLNRPEKFPSLSVLKEKAFSAAFLALALLAMTGWVYLLSSILFKFVLWCVDYFVQ